MDNLGETIAVDVAGLQPPIDARKVHVYLFSYGFGFAAVADHLLQI